MIIGTLTEGWFHLPANEGVELYHASESREKFGHLNWGPMFDSETVILESGDFEDLLNIIEIK